jgi:hypothetical protein
MRLTKWLLQPLDRFRSRTVAQRMLAPLGLIPIDQTQSSDVFIVGFPKSGNTWLQTLTAALVFGVDIERCPDTLVQDVVPDIYDRPFYRRYLTSAYFKSHELPSPRHGRVVYVIRDGRDVMVSYWHFMQAMGSRCASLRELVESPTHGFDVRWQDHVERWLANPYKSEMLVLRYEELSADPRLHARRLMDFLGITVDDAVLDRALYQCSFDQMKQREKRLGWDNKKWPADKAFARRGKVGSHRDEMDAATRELFEKQAGGLLHSLGYDLALNQDLEREKDDARVDRDSLDRDCELSQPR